MGTFYSLISSIHQDHLMDNHHHQNTRIFDVRGLSSAGIGPSRARLTLTSDHITIDTDNVHLQFRLSQIRRYGAREDVFMFETSSHSQNPRRNQYAFQSDEASQILNELEQMIATYMANRRSEERFPSQTNSLMDLSHGPPPGYDTTTLFNKTVNFMQDHIRVEGYSC
ncbi:hypothetical protein ACOME3_005405 [Neoechinorhynchus agilis]